MAGKKPKTSGAIIEDAKELALEIEKAYLFKQTIVRAHDEVDQKFAEMIAEHARAEELLRGHVLAGGELPPNNRIGIARIEGRKDISVDGDKLLAICSLLRDGGHPGIADMIESCVTTKERLATTQMRYL